MSTIVLTVGLQLDPAALGAIKSQLASLGGAAGGAGASPAQNILQQYKQQLLQMQQQGKAALSQQNFQQAQSLQSQKAGDALSLAASKSTLAQQLASQKAGAAQQLATQKSNASLLLANTYATNNQQLAAQKFGYQQQILTQRQAFQVQQQQARDQAKQQSQAYKEFSAYVAAQKFYGAASLLNTLNLPGGKAISSVGNIVQLLGGSLGVPAATGIGALVTAGGAAINFGRESIQKYQGVQTPIALLRALTGASPAEARSLQQQGRQLSLGTGQSQEELAQAAYFISSSGFSGKGAQQVLSASSLASQAGLGSTKNFADLLTSSLQAYGEQASSAIKYTDVFTATVREGKAEPEQLAKSLGLVLPIAAAAGVRIEEVGAAIATITRTGSTAPQAVTQLKQTISNLIDPSKEAIKSLKELGLTPGDIAKRLKSEGLGEVLKDIDARATATGNRETVLSQIFGNIRAYTGVLSLARGEFDTYDEILGRITQSQGNTMAAAVIMGSTMEQQAQRIQSAFDGIQITLGEKFAPAAQEVGNAVEAMLLRINNDLGGDIGDVGKMRLTQQTRKANTATNLINTLAPLGQFLPGAAGQLFQGYGLLRMLGINPTGGGSPLTSTGFGLINPKEIPSQDLGKQEELAKAELAKAQARMKGAGFLGSLNPYMKGDIESLTSYIAQIQAQRSGNFSSVLPGGSSKVREQYENQRLPGAPPEATPSMYGATPLEPKDLAARNKLIIQTATGQVDNILKTSASFEDAFSGSGDAFKTIEKLNKLKDQQVHYSYAVVNGQKVENESTIKSMKLVDQYKGATEKLTRAENNLNTARNAKKPNPNTIANAEISVNNAKRDLALFNAQNPNALTVASAFNADGTPIAGPDGKPAEVKTVSGTRRRGLSKKEQDDLDEAQRKIDAFNKFLDNSFQDRAVGGFETALNGLADTSKDGVAPALALTTKQLENYLGATGKAKTVTYTLGLGLQALDNSLADGSIGYEEYLTKLKNLQDGIKGLAPQITGGAPLTIEQAVKFKLVSNFEADLAGQVDQLTKEANQFGKKGKKGAPVNQGTEADDKKLMRAIDAKQKIQGAGASQIVQQLLASQGIDVNQGLEIPIKSSLTAAGVDTANIDKSITEARTGVMKDAEKPLEPKPPVTMGLGQVTDNISGPINSSLDNIVGSIKGRTVYVPITMVASTTTTTVDGGAGGAGGTGDTTPPTGSTTPPKTTQPPRKTGGGGGGNKPQHRSGGRVKRGKAVIVGDGGLPETFIPDEDGYIVQGGATKDILKQLYTLGYAVDSRGPYDFIPPPTTVAQVEDLARLYPASDLAKWVKKNQSKDTAFVHPFLGPQLTDEKLKEIAASTPDTAAGVYLAEKAKMDALIQQRDAPAIYRTEGAIEKLNEQIDGLKLSAKSARQAASAQYYDPSTGRKVGYGLNGIQSMSSLTAQSTADALTERQRQDNLLRFKALQSTTTAIINSASKIASEALSASIVTGAGGGATPRPYRPADPVPRSTRRPGSRGSIQQYAAGGVYRAGTLAQVGELGPEYFVSDTSGIFINAANSSRLNSLGGGRFLDGATSVVSHSYDNRQTFQIDARGSSNPQAVRRAAERGARAGASEAMARRRLRATGRI